MVGRSDINPDTLKFAEAAIAQSKRDGLLLAVQARWVALAVTAVTLPIINPNWEVIYYILMLGFFRGDRLGATQGRQGGTFARRTFPDVLRSRAVDLS